MSIEGVCVWIIQSSLWMCLLGYGGTSAESERGERQGNNSRGNQDLYISETGTTMARGRTLPLAMFGCQLDSNCRQRSQFHSYNEE